MQSMLVVVEVGRTRKGKKSSVEEEWGLSQEGLYGGVAKICDCVWIAQGLCRGNVL